MLGSIAEFDREIRLERQPEGIATASAEGNYEDYQPIEDTKLQQVQTLVEGAMTVSKAVSKVGIAWRTYYKAIGESPEQVEELLMLMAELHVANCPNRAEPRAIK